MFDFIQGVSGSLFHRLLKALDLAPQFFAFYVWNFMNKFKLENDQWARLFQVNRLLSVATYRPLTEPSFTTGDRSDDCDGFLRTKRIC